MGMHIPQYTQCSQEISLGVGRLPTWNVPTKLPSFPIASQGNAITNAVVRVYKLLSTDYNEPFHIHPCNASEKTLA